MKKINVDGLHKQLLKVLKMEYTADGLYVNIYSINYTFWEDEYKDPLIVVIGAYGRDKADGTNNFYHQFELHLDKDKLKKIDFVNGMFYQMIISQTEDVEE